jgi:tetratricopeptide (TPR) repeat protein
VVDSERVLADRFEIERLAGSGGMGKVYRAHDRWTGQPVALKVLQSDGAAEIERFAREAEVLAGLAHPAIVRFVAHGQTPEGEPYLAIEWLEGEDLGARLKRKGLTIAETMALGVRVADGLGAAHRIGVVHRDVKPGNIWLVGGKPEEAKVLDFGIARWVVGVRTLTQVGAMLGTPGYMPPEQARGDRRVDPRADVFSLGAVLFKCITGRLPFEGEDVMAVLLKLVLEEPPRLGQLRPEVPPALEDLVARMLAKEAEGRPADGVEVARLLVGIELGDVGDAAPAMPAIAALTGTERPVMCVVLAKLGEAHFDDVASASGEVTVATPAASRRALASALEAFGGNLSVLADGSLLVTIPGGGAFTDQATRAARSALAVRARHPDAAVAVIAGRGEMSARLPMGEVIDRGVDLLRRARPGDIRLDEGIAGLVASAFEIRGDEQGLVLTGERAAEVKRTLLGRETPFVGREREMMTLEAIFDEVANESVAHAILVTAPAGVGKSRLRLEIVRRVRAKAAEARGDLAAAKATTGLSDPPPRAAEGAFEVWLGRGDVIKKGSPFGLIAPLVRRVAGVLEGEAIEVRRRKLSARVGRHLGGADRARVTVFLGELAGVPFPDEDCAPLRAARQDAILMGDQMRRAFEDFLAAECAAGPVAIVLDDVQWGDRPSLQFLDAALRNLADRPLLVLALARPEASEMFPGLWAGRPVTELKLSALSKKASEKLACDVLPDAPKETIDRLVALAGGDAFYLEELIRAVAEGKGDSLPETVLAMVEQRLAGLDARTRRVLRAASVFGGVFWARGLVALLGGEERATAVNDALADLAARELVSRRPIAKFPEEDEYVFRQTLVREAAYAMLTEHDRRLGHRLAGEWLLSAGESDPVVLAEHFERAGEPERALSSYHEAAAQALEGNDIDQALAFSERAMARIGDVAGRAPDDPVLAALGALRALHAEALRWRDDLAQAAESAAEATRLLPRGSTAWFTVAGDRASLAARLGREAELDGIAGELLSLWPPEPSAAQIIAAARAATYLVLRGAYARADELLAKIADAEPREHEPSARARMAQAMGARAMVRGDLAEHRARTEAAVAHFSEAGDQRNACLARITLAFAETGFGRYEAAAAGLREALATAERMNLSSLGAYAKHTLGYAAARLGDVDEAIAMEAEAVEAFTVIGDRRLAGGSRGYLAAILAQAGDLAAAEREATEAIEGLASVPPVRAYALATRAKIRRERGDTAGALADAEAAHALLQELGGIEEGEALVRLSYAEALDAAGRRDDARAAIAAARARLHERAAKIGDAEMRERFLHAVAENARTLALADEWADSA